MRNLLICVIVAFIATASLLSQPVSRQEFEVIKARVAALENSINKNDTYHVIVNYSLPLEQAVKLGNFNWVHHDVTSDHFPTKRTGKAEVDIQLIHFNRDISSNDAITELDSMGLRPAEALEFCALVEKYPKLQDNYSIVSLGSAWRILSSGRPVYVIYSDHTRCWLFPTWFCDDWHAHDCFAAVRK